MFDKLSSEKYFCGVDIGSHSIKAGLMHAVNGQQHDMIGVFESPTYGFRSGSVTDLSELAECLTHCVGGLSKRTGIDIKEVYVGLASSLIDIRDTSAVIPLADRGNKIITQKDVRQLDKQARLLGIKIEEEVLHHIPQSYIVDDVNIALNPVGLTGRKLGVESVVMVAQTARLQNISLAIHQAGYDIKSYFLNTLCAADVIFDQEDKSDGCILVDVGASKTTILIFKDKSLAFLRSIPLGGDLLTSRIAKELNLSFELAEEIKKSYAGVLASDREDEEDILVKKDNAYIPIKRKKICLAIESEVENFIDNVHHVLQSSDCLECVHRGVTMIGGGSLLSGLMERINDKSRLPVNLAKMKLLSTKPIMHSATFSSVVGLAYHGYQNSQQITFNSKSRRGWVNGAIGRVVDLYHEYF